MEFTDSDSIELSKKIIDPDKIIPQEISLEIGEGEQEIEDIKEDFKKDLEGSLNGLVLTDLKKDDLSERVDKLLNSYQDNERFKQASELDDQLSAKLSTFGNNEVANDWVTNRIGNTNIFESYPKEIYKEKQALQKNLKEWKGLTNKKNELVKKKELDGPMVNQYHKFLNGQKSFEEFDQDVKKSKSYKSGEKQRKNIEGFVREVKKIDKKEQKLKEEIRENKYLEYIRKEHGEELDYLQDLGKTESLNEELAYSKLNSHIQQEEIKTLLNNDFLSSTLSEQQNPMGKVGAGVIKNELLQQLDSSQEKWVTEASKIYDNPEKSKNEVTDLVLKESDESRILPKNVFFEGIVGFAKGDFTVFSLSPNFGYEFTNGPSVGLGVTLHHTEDKEAYIRTALDYKAFCKYSMFKELIFLQTEYVAMIPGISYLEAREGETGFKNTVLMGGGISFKIKGKKALSLGMMYNLNQNMGVPTYDSPFLARFGVKLF